MQLSELEPRLADALAAHKLLAKVEIEYYKTDTLVVPPLTLAVDENGHFVASIQIERQSTISSIC